MFRLWNTDLSKLAIDDVKELLKISKELENMSTKLLTELGVLKTIKDAKKGGKTLRTKAGNLIDPKTGDLEPTLQRHIQQTLKIILQLLHSGKKDAKLAIMHELTGKHQAQQ